MACCTAPPAAGFGGLVANLIIQVVRFTHKFGVCVCAPQGGSVTLLGRSFAVQQQGSVGAQAQYSKAAQRQHHTRASTALITTDSTATKFSQQACCRELVNVTKLQCMRQPACHAISAPSCCNSQLILITAICCCYRCVQQRCVQGRKGMISYSVCVHCYTRCSHQCPTCIIQMHVRSNMGSIGQRPHSM